MIETVRKDLKGKTIRGGFVKVCGQLVNFILRTGSLMVLARLLEPRDFGLVGMVTAVTGVLHLFKDFGLSTVTVQRAQINKEQISTLFWINLLFGILLALLSVSISPLLAALYKEPRLIVLTAILASGFIFNAAGVQHAALLQRQMRFFALSVMDVISLFLSVAVGVGMAVAGYGYWALVAMNVSLPATWTICLWLSTEWIPGRPRRDVDLPSMLRFGGIFSLSNLMTYISCNLDKVLLGRFYGAGVLGVYGRAYQIIAIPPDNIMFSALGGVAFAGLSRLREDPVRLKNYFLRGYALVLELTLPITIFCGLFAEEIVLIALGPKWKEAAPILRLLAPSMVAFSLISPTLWFLFTVENLGRCLKISLAMTPIVIAGYTIGLHFGPRGVALGFSAGMTLWVFPHLFWSFHGTVISLREIMRTLSKPLLSATVAGLLAAPVQFAALSGFHRSACAVLAGSIFIFVYSWMLLFIMSEKAFYRDILRELLGRSSAPLDPSSVELSPVKLPLPPAKPVA